VAIQILLLLVLKLTPIADGLDHYQWQNRLVVFIGEQTPKDKEILKDYQSLKEELEEKKIKFIQVSNQGIKEVFPAIKQVSSTSETFNTFKKRYPKSSILLIGLDGGVKRKTNTLFKPKELFGIIDSMPMRASEIRRKNE